MPRSIVVQESLKGTVALCPEGRWLSVGRDTESNELVIDDKHVSRRHCQLQAQPDGRLRVADRSSFGTYVDGERIGGEAYVLAGARLTLGKGIELRVVGSLDPDAARPSGPQPHPPCWMGADYLLLREVGRGAAGIVYEAWDQRRRRRCALKWLREGGAATDDAMARFRAEAMLQGQLRDYPGIVSVDDLGVVTGSGDMFCVMEFVDGESLLGKVKDEAPREELVRLVARVARAVAYAHEQGVLHRDLKPANVLVTADGGVRLTDFGLARALLRGNERKTATGMMLGTPGYMAPEQINDAKRAGAPADIYALGAILYTVLTKKLPVHGRSMREALNKLRIGDPSGIPTPRELDPSVDTILEAACLRALELEPADRWPSAGAFAEELERWLRHAEPPAKVRLQGPGAR